MTPCFFFTMEEPRESPEDGYQPKDRPTVPLAGGSAPVFNRGTSGVASALSLVHSRPGLVHISCLLTKIRPGTAKIIRRAEMIITTNMRSMVVRAMT